MQPGIDWDALCDTELRRHLHELLASLRNRMKARYDRHVSTGNLLHDRWELARAYGFGEGTSAYDDCLILGDVKMGRDCWVGPYTVLDGSGQLTIGDCVDIGAGAHLYSHNTIERALTGRKTSLFRKATTIGSCCFIALHALGVGPGDEVITVSHSFIATANAVRYCGATPIFVDIDPRTFNLDPALLEAAITPRTRAILPVHQIGLPCDLARILAIANRYGRVCNGSAANRDGQADTV
jgi:acetyltransferase-like isoleucine patch superfamily enzyme